MTFLEIRVSPIGLLKSAEEKKNLRDSSRREIKEPLKRTCNLLRESRQTVVTLRH